MSVDADRLRRIALQHARTAQLMGVDFVPIGVAPAVEDGAASAPDAEPTPRRGVAHGGSEKQALLDALRARHDVECPHCTRATGHTQTVFGEGNPDASLMFVGEAPGAEEDKSGRPFVGRSGKLLDTMIEAMGMRREDVYIANVLKSRPPDNRTPTPEEAALCGPYLREQIAIIRPGVIMTLGKPAAQLLLESRETMGALRGRWFEYDDTPLMPTFHPAFLLRQYTRENRMKVWSDLQKVMEKLGLRAPAQG